VYVVNYGFGLIWISIKTLGIKTLSIVLQCCILVKNETSNFFRNCLMFRGASGLPTFDVGS